MRNFKIAVVGSGISGLSSAYYLSKNFKVDLFGGGDCKKKGVDFCARLDAPEIPANSAELCRGRSWSQIVHDLQTNR